MGWTDMVTPLAPLISGLHKVIFMGPSVILYTYIFIIFLALSSSLVRSFVQPTMEFAALRSPAIPAMVAWPVGRSWRVADGPATEGSVSRRARLVAQGTTQQNSVPTGRRPRMADGGARSRPVRGPGTAAELAHALRLRSCGCVSRARTTVEGRDLPLPCSDLLLSLLLPEVERSLSSPPAMGLAGGRRPARPAQAARLGCGHGPPRWAAAAGLPAAENLPGQRRPLGSATAGSSSPQAAAEHCLPRRRWDSVAVG